MEQPPESPGKKYNVFHLYINCPQEIMNNEKSKVGVVTSNCPLMATLKMFFSSARSANKNIIDASTDSGRDEDEEDYDYNYEDDE